MRKQPGGVKPNGFISDGRYFIAIDEYRPLLTEAHLKEYGIFTSLESEQNFVKEGYYVAEAHGPHSTAVNIYFSDTCKKLLEEKHITT